MSFICEMFLYDVFRKFYLCLMEAFSLQGEIEKAFITEHMKKKCERNFKVVEKYSHKVDKLTIKMNKLKDIFR